MIVELILMPIWLLIDLIINLFPSVANTVYNFLSSSDVLAVGLYFLPIGYWGQFLASVTFWLTANFTWSIIEWVYKKIPGIS